MANWNHSPALDTHRATAGELISMSIEKKPDNHDLSNPIWAGLSSEFMVILTFGNGLTKTLTGFKKIKQAKRAAEAEANRLLATAMMDLNIEEQIKRGFKIGR